MTLPRRPTLTTEIVGDTRLPFSRYHLEMLERSYRILAESKLRLEQSTRPGYGLGTPRINVMCWESYIDFPSVRTSMLCIIPVAMTDADAQRYRRRAGECRESAKNANPHEREAWLRLAADWDTLAQAAKQRRPQILGETVPLTRPSRPPR